MKLRWTFILSFGLFPLLYGQAPLKDVIIYEDTLADQSIIRLVGIEYQTGEKGNYHLEFFAANQDSVRKVPLNEVFYSTGNPIEEIHCQFTDSLHGFLYGNEVGYGIWPVLLRTEDGGRSWSRFIYEEREYGAILTASCFHMFDQNRGILFVNDSDKDELIYELTTDGGKTWKRFKTKLNGAVGQLINAPGYFEAHFESTGKIHVLLSNPSFASHNNGVYLELFSTDFGQTFIEKRPSTN